MITDNPAIDHGALLQLLKAEWCLEATRVAFLPVGGGSWSYRSGDWFVNVRHADDSHTPWDTRRDVAQSFAVASALRERCGLDCLLAPTPTASGDPTAPLGPFVVVVTPFIDGVVRGWDPFSREELLQAVEWIARIHEATPAVSDLPLASRRFELGFVHMLRDAVERTFERDRATPFNRRLAELRWLIDLGEIALAPRELDLYVLRRAARPEDRDVVPELDGDLARYYDDRWNLSEITEYLDHLSRSDGADVPEDTRWDWRYAAEPAWRTEGRARLGTAALLPRHAPRLIRGRSEARARGPRRYSATTATVGCSTATARNSTPVHDRTRANEFRQ